MDAHKKNSWYCYRGLGNHRAGGWGWHAPQFEIVKPEPTNWEDSLAPATGNATRAGTRNTDTQIMKTTTLTTPSDLSAAFLKLKALMKVQNGMLNTLLQEIGGLVIAKPAMRSDNIRVSIESLQEAAGAVSSNKTEIRRAMAELQRSVETIAHNPDGGKTTPSTSEFTQTEDPTVSENIPEEERKRLDVED